jgi:hypothetical protein
MERLDEIAAELLRDVDSQVTSAVETVRSAVERRRRAFASDLYQQFEIVQEISEDPSRLEAYRRDAERFIQAFDGCATRARAARHGVRTFSLVQPLHPLTRPGHVGQSSLSSGRRVRLMPVRFRVAAGTPASRQAW